MLNLTSYETLESTGERKLMVKHYLKAFAQYLYTLKFIFCRSHGKLFLVLFQATICLFSIKKMKKDCKLKYIKFFCYQIFSTKI